MKLGAYQFPVTGNPQENFRRIRTACDEAAQQGVRLVIFPECALSRYPSQDVPSVSYMDFQLIAKLQGELQELADQLRVTLLVGSACMIRKQVCSSALILSPGQPRQHYHKRALWGWDDENFFPRCQRRRVFR